MKRILLALFFGFVFGTIVFGQQPVNPAPVQMAPLVNFDAVIEQIIESFTDILKEFWVMILSVFFVWVIFMSAISFLEGRLERWKAEKRMRHSMVARENLRAEIQDQRRLIRQQELEQSRIAEQHEWEYRSRELSNLLLRDREHLGERETIDQIDGTYYVRSSSKEGDIIEYKTLEKWRSEHDAEDSKPLDFDNNDYDRVYESIVESDYKESLEEEYREYRTDYGDTPEGLELYEPLTYDEDIYEEWRKAEYGVAETRGSFSYWAKEKARENSFRRNREELDEDNDFEREYGHRRGEFYGGY